MSLFKKLLGATVLTPVASGGEPPAPAAGGSSAQAAAATGGGLSEGQIEAALQAAKAEGHAEGATAERERTAAVFASHEGKANMGTAAWMLGSNPAASAESIIAHLKTMPAQASSAPAGQQAAAAPPLATPLAETPQADLNGSKPAATASDGNSGAGAADHDKMWAEVQAAGKERFLNSLAGSAASTVAVGGMTLSTRTGH